MAIVLEHETFRVTHRTSSRAIRVVAASLLLAILSPRVDGQVGTTSLTLLSSEGRRTVPLTLANGQPLVAVEDLAPIFQLTVRQEAGATTVQYRNSTIVLTPGQALASAGGRVISLSVAPSRASGRLLVPLDFISRALAPIYETRLDLRVPSRLLVIGDVRVPRVAVRHEVLPEGARLTVDTVPRTTYAIAQDGARLNIRFDADALDLTIQTFAPSPVLNGVRSGDAVSVVAELGPRFASYRTTTESLNTGSRLVIDLLPTRTETPTLTGPGAPPLPPTASPELPGLSPAGPALRTLVLDPGHGGDDNGARGPDGTLEKDVALAVARRLKTLVETQLGIRVLLTRDDDRSIPLDRRTALANNNKADVFLSLHANASPVDTLRGASLHLVVFDDADRARGSVAADRLALFTGGWRELQLLPWDVAQIRHLDRSAELAAILEGTIGPVTSLAPRSIERGSFRVLEAANMPAVLVEMGYLTNRDDERRLSSGSFQGELAQALFHAIVRFQQTMTDGGGER